MTIDQQQTALTIRILGKDYSVACPENERESLLHSAEHLSQRMATIQRQGKTRSTERIAIMAALNIARDLLELQRKIEAQGLDKTEEQRETTERLSQLQAHVRDAIDNPG